MADNMPLLEKLQVYCDELTPKEFYRAIFPAGTLEKKGEQVKGGFNAMAVEMFDKNSKIKARTYIVTDDLEIIDKLNASQNFAIISPITYAGKSGRAINGRYIYALAIDLDGIETQAHINDLFHHIESEYIPKPSYIVWSGQGVHLYYQFENPIPCYKNITKQLGKMKQGLTKLIWNKYITTQYNKPQYQSLFQGFRVVGTVTKAGNKTRAFAYGGPITIDYLNGFVSAENKVTEIVYKSKMTLEEAREKYPEWYEKRIIKKQASGGWYCHRGLYEWWLDKLKEEIVAGHRFYGVAVLSVYAIKCNISRKELEADARSLLEPLDDLTVNEDNHFTIEDIYSALEFYNDDYITFPIDTITKLTAIEIKKNKRNWRKQKMHLEMARSNLAIMNKYNDKALQGRPSKAEDVKEWRRTNPNGTKKECIEQLAISKSTVYKYWNQ